MNKHGRRETSSEQRGASWRRRSLLQATAATVAVSGWSAPATGAGLPSDPSLLDPLGDLKQYPNLRPLMFDQAGAKQLVSHLWGLYGQTGERRYGEWAATYAFVWWRTLPDRGARVKAARVGQKMAAAIADKHPEHAAGPQWLAIHLGTEILSVGVLDALQSVPALKSNLEQAMAADAGYFYGLPSLILAKVYSKLPAFPVSVGNIDKSLALLDRLAPKQRETFAIWHLFLAEAVYLKHGVEDALKILAGFPEIVEPRDPATAYLYESTLQDASNLRERLVQGNYNRYVWDPLLEVAKPGSRLG